MTDGKEVIQQVRAIEGLDIRYADEDVVLICGDNREVVPRLAEAGVLVDSVVTDPPYGLEFMGHDWDKLQTSSAHWETGGTFSRPGIGDRNTEWPSFSSKAAPNKTCEICGGRQRGKKNKRCHCEVPKWKPIGERRKAAVPPPGNLGGFADGNKPSFARVASHLPKMQAWHLQWASAVLKVVKPGAFLFAFGGTRTSHRLACAIEDAGWEIRDEIENVVSGDQKWNRFWASLNSEQQGAYLEAVAPTSRCSMMFGSGFPKGLNVSVAIDKSLGQEREAVGQRVYADGTVGSWRKQSSTKYAQDDWTQDASDRPKIETAQATDAAKLWQGWNVAMKPSYEPIIVAMAPMPGSFAENAIKYGVAGLWVDGARLGVGGEKAQPGAGGLLSHIRDGKPYPGNGRDGEDSADRRYHDTGSTDLAALPGPRGGDPTGRWPPNTSMEHHQGCVCVGGETVTSHNGVRGTDVGNRMYGGGTGLNRETTGQVVGYADENGREAIAKWSCAAACECGHVFPDSSKTVPGSCPRCQSPKTDWICPVRILDSQAGNDHGGGFPQARKSAKTKGVYGAFAEGHLQHGPRRMGKGGASRFFYTSKASSSERDCGLRGKIPCHHCGGLESVHHLMRREDRKVFGAQDCGRDGIPTVKEVAAELKRLRGKAALRDYPWLLVKCHRNYHPTLKSISVMRWIVRLSKTPTGGVVLDPFAGSATTGVACMLEGRPFILIEQDSGYCEIGAARLRACRDGAFEKSQKKSVKKSSPAPMVVASRANVKSSQGHRTLFPME